MRSPHGKNGKLCLKKPDVQVQRVNTIQRTSFPHLVGVLSAGVCVAFSGTERNTHLSSKKIENGVVG